MPAYVATARREITPVGKFFPCHLMGHAIRTDAAVGIMDPLWATAMLLEVDNVRFVWVTVELIGLERQFTDDIKSVIFKKHGIPAERVTVCFVHTHSAPEYQDKPKYGKVGAVPGYMDYVKSQILAAVDDCFEKGTASVTPYARTVLIDGCYSNRNGIEKPCDKSVTTIAFRDTDGRTAAGIGHFTCHSTVLGPGNLYVSSDLAGYVARALEKEWGVYPLIFIGAAGDMSNRMYRQGNDEKELYRVGDEMMGQVLAVRDERELDLSSPTVHTWHFNETYYPDPAKKQAQYDEIAKKVANAKTFDEKKVYTSALAMAKNSLECKPCTIDMVCRYINLGDLRLFTIPAELFSRFGIKLKEAMGAKCSICWCYCDYSVGYLGNIEDYGASFETAASDIPPGTTERMVDDIVDFIKECDKEQ